MHTLSTYTYGVTGTRITPESKQTALRLVSHIKRLVTKRPRRPSFHRMTEQRMPLEDLVKLLENLNDDRTPKNPVGKSLTLREVG